MVTRTPDRRKVTGRLMTSLSRGDRMDMAAAMDHIDITMAMELTGLNPLFSTSNGVNPTGGMWLVVRVSSTVMSPWLRRFPVDGVLVRSTTEAPET